MLLPEKEKESPLALALLEDEIRAILFGRAMTASEGEKEEEEGGDPAIFKMGSQIGTAFGNATFGAGRVVVPILGAVRSPRHVQLEADCSCRDCR